MKIIRGRSVLPIAYLGVGLLQVTKDEVSYDGVLKGGSENCVEVAFKVGGRNGQLLAGLAEQVIVGLVEKSRKSIRRGLSTDFIKQTIFMKHTFVEGVVIYYDSANCENLV